MSIRQDWILRQVDMLIQFVARLIFKKDSIKYEIHDESNLSETDLLYKKLKQLISEYKICEAEDLLFDNLNVDSQDYLELAVDFYQTLNKMTDEELEEHNFSREEVNEGVNDIMRKFNIPTLQA